MNTESQILFAKVPMSLTHFQKNKPKRLILLLNNLSWPSLANFNHVNKFRQRYQKCLDNALHIRVIQ